MRIAALVSCAVLASAFPAMAEGTTPEESTKAWHRLVGILQYLEADYPAAVASGSAFELEEQRSFSDEAVAAAEGLGTEGRPFVEKLVQLRALVHASGAAEQVSRSARGISEGLIAAGGLLRSPRRAPDLAQGATHHQTMCASCHARDGSAKVEIARTMEPPPASFLSPEGMDALTPYKAFNTISFGVTGTGMPSFSTLAEKDRWALAFFLFTLRQPPCERQPPKVSLEELATSTDPQLAGRYGQDAVACLRRKLPELDEEVALLSARSGVERAIAGAQGGNFDGAHREILDAYLNGLEPVEPLLSARDPKLTLKLEEAFFAARLSAEQRSGTFAEDGKRLIAALDAARRSKASRSIFWFALLVVLREGFEAMVVIAALLAVLKKMGEQRHARFIHLGWTAALVVGAGAFIFGRHLLDGRDREGVEGIVALAAVAMLLYAALWLNRRSNIRKLMGELRGKMGGALGRGSVAGLFTISFTAMLRESFETALFLQGLAIDSPSQVAYGALAGSAALVGLVLMVKRVGYRLPMKALFDGSTALLFATAVILLGKGIHALQEAGALPLRPIAFFTVDLLGIYPDAYSALPQLALALAPLAYVVLRPWVVPPKAVSADHT